MRYETERETRTMNELSRGRRASLACAGACLLTAAISGAYGKQALGFGLSPGSDEGGLHALKLAALGLSGLLALVAMATLAVALMALGRVVRPR
jgi:hypothetical protein